MNSLYCFCQLSGAHICVPAGGDDIAGAAKASAAFNPCGYALDADVVACLRYISSTVAACTAADGEETDAASAPVTSAAQRSLVMSEMPRPRTLSAMVFCRIWIWPALLGRPYDRTALRRSRRCCASTVTPRPLLASPTGRRHGSSATRGPT